MRPFLGAVCLLALVPWLAAQPVSPSPTPTPTVSLVPDVPAGEVEEVPSREVDPQALYETGKTLWENYVPENIRSQYEFPSREEWDAFFAKIQTSLDQESFSEVAKMEEEVKQAVTTLNQVPVYAEYMDWLQERLDFVEMAKLIAQSEAAPSPPPPSPLPTPPGDETRPRLPTLPPTPFPSRVPEKSLIAQIPHYPLWVNRLKERPQPARAASLMPKLKASFAAEGVPAALAWIAEVESSLNPQAKSPAGAFGLFQLMPTTAKSLGLSTFPFDERAHPEKSAQAAARHLKALYKRFGNWPLALAAYNAGDGRVSRALKKHGPNADFAAICPSLSVETRMYVPKVLATVSLREGVELAALKAAPAPVAVAQP